MVPVPGIVYNPVKFLKNFFKNKNQYCQKCSTWNIPHQILTPEPKTPKTKKKLQSPLGWSQNGTMSGENFDQNVVPVDPEPTANDLDTGNPRSVLNLLTPGIRAPIRKAMEERAYLFQMDEHELWRSLGKLKSQPGPIDNRLRLAFWNEYNRAQADMDTMRGVNIYSGICTHQHFTERYLKCPEKVAWLMCPPTSYEVALEEALQFGIDQLRDILALPVKDKKGKVNTSLASLKERIIARLDERKHGATVQRSINVSVQKNASDDKKIQEILLTNNMDEIQRRIRDLDKRDRLAPKQDVEVQSEPVQQARPDSQDGT